MHPFHLSQVIYFGIIILVIAALFIFEKLSKRSLPKATIIVYSLTSLLLVSIVVSIYFFMLHDYSLLFPANYFQPHNYLFAVFALLILVNIYSKQGSDISAFNQKNKLLLCCSLIMLVLLMVVPTSEKIADYYHRSQASEMLGMDDEMIDTAITHDVSSCRENPEYRKTYQIFDCEIEGSRVYYMYAKNT